MDYVVCEIWQVAKAKWLSFVPHLGLTCEGPTRLEVEKSTYDLIEEAEGAKMFRILWRG